MFPVFTTISQLEKQYEQLDIQLAIFERSGPATKNEESVLHIKAKAEEVLNQAFRLGKDINESFITKVLTLTERAEELLKRINKIASNAKVAPAASSSAVQARPVSPEPAIDYQHVIDRSEFDSLKIQDQSGQAQTVVTGKKYPADTLVMLEYPAIKGCFRFGTLVDGQPGSAKYLDEHGFEIDRTGRYQVLAFVDYAGRSQFHWHQAKNLYLVNPEEAHRTAPRPLAALQAPAVLQNSFAPITGEVITSAAVQDLSSLYYQVITEHPEDLNDALAMLSIPGVQEIQDHEISAVMVCYINAECAVHEILPGLFLGGGNYTPKDHHIYRYDGSRGPVMFDQVICATRDRPQGCFNPARGTPCHEVPSDPNRSPPDVTLDSLKANNQAGLNAAIRRLDESLKSGRRTFVYCSQGKDRSASIVIGYLMSKYHVTYQQALTFVRSRRFIADPGPAYVEFFEHDFKKLDLGDPNWQG